MREVLLSRNGDNDVVLDWIDSNRKVKKNVYETYVELPGGRELTFQTTSKELHLGFGRMGLSVQWAFAGVLLEELKSEVQVILRFDGDTPKQKPLLVTKFAEEDSMVVLNFTVTH